MRSMMSPSSSRSTTSMPLRTCAKTVYVVVQPGVVHEVDEDLRVAGVASARGDPDRAPDVRPEPDLVAHELGVADVLVGPGAAALRSTKFGTTPVERQAVVVAGLGELDEVQHRGGRFGREQRQLERADVANGDARARRREAAQVLGGQTMTARVATAA